MKKILSLVLIALLCVGLLAACVSTDKGPTLEERLANAKDYLDAQMNNKAESTPGDYTVYGKLSINESGSFVSYDVTWTVTDRNGNEIDDDDVEVDVAEDGTVTIRVNKEAEEDILYTLHAVISKDGQSVSSAYERKVPKFQELTHAQFTSTADDAAVVIKGIINGIVNTSSKWELYLQDNDGGYYVYGLKQDQVKDLQIGQEIRVRGIKGTYYGVHQVENGTIEVLNATPVTVEATDITNAIKSASGMDDKALAAYQSMYVKIADINILGQITGDTTYYDILVGNLQTYIRISGSANMLNSADTTTFKDTFLGNIGSGADAYGIVSLYNNKLYLLPVEADAVKNLHVVERTPAEQVEFETRLLDAVGAITEPGKLNLQNAAKVYTDVTFSWSLAENDYATLAGNVINVNVLPDEAQTVALTLTLANGDATYTKIYNLKINAAPTVVADTDIDFVAEQAYVLVINQKNISATLYWNGEIASNRLQSTKDPSKAATIKAKLVEGTTDKYILYTQIGSSVQYIDVDDVTDYTTPNVTLARYETNLSNYFTYDSERKIFTVEATVANKDKTATEKQTFYFGAYNSYDTMSLSNTSYISGSNAANVDVTQFPARFATLIDTITTPAADQIAREKADLDIKTSFAAAETITLPANGALFNKIQITWSTEDTTGAIVIADNTLSVVPQGDATTIAVVATFTLGETTDTKTFNISVPAKTANLVPEKAETFVAGTAYKLVYFHTTNGVYQYFNGTKGSYYANTTKLAVEAVDVYIEEATGGYYIYFMVDGVKTYFEAYMSGTYCNVQFVTTTPASVFVTDAEYGVPTVTFGEQTYFLGTYGTNNDIRPSKMSFITEGNYVCSFYNMVEAEEDEGGSTPPAEPETPEITLTTIPDALAAGEAGKTDLIYLEGVVVDNKNTKYGNIWLADANGNLIYLYGLKDADGTVQNPAYGTYIRVKANTGVYSGVGQLTNSVVVDSTAPTADTKVILAWYQLTCNTIFDGDATLTLPTSADATITWTKDGVAYTDATIAIVQTSELQEFTLVATLTNGTVTLTKEFTINVKAASSYVTESATLEFTASSLTTQTNTQNIFEGNGITLTNNKGTYNNNLADYTAPARIYAGTEVIISHAGMTEITFNVNSGKPVDGLVNALTDTDNYSVSVNGFTVTLTFNAPTDSLTFNATAQFRLDSIVIKYVAE